MFTRLTRRPDSTESFRGFGRTFALILLLLSVSGVFTPGQAATYGEIIPNQATLQHSVGGGPIITTDSNIVEFIVRSPATIEFLKYAPSTPVAEDVPIPPTYYDDGTGTLVLIPEPPPTSAPTVPVVSGPAGGSPLFYVSETIYLRLTDPDQNTDKGAPDTVIVTVTCTETGDVETLQITETGDDTGVFTGYLPAAPSGPISVNGEIAVVDGCNLEASYTDSSDNTDITVAAALVDPFGVVFDSSTGDPIDGAIVTLYEVLPDNSEVLATVFDDDGTTPFPATVTSGDSALGFPAGGFRFPYILPGTYRLDVTVPPEYVVPSTTNDAQLLIVRPGSAIVNGSRGEVFTIDPGPAVRIDIPADPLISDLWLQKDANREDVETGDFLQYVLTLENTNQLVTAGDVSITDTLPAGFRYQSGSTRIDGVKSPNPKILSDGRTLVFTLGDLPPDTTREVKYVVEVGAGATAGQATNRAIASSSNGNQSNQATKTVTIKEPFFRNSTFLVGRVLSGSCEQPDQEMAGVGNVRIYLEDGSYVLTDKDGRYHFEGVEPGIHVVQVDTTTIPQNYEMLPCEQTSQTAGRTFSQFVDLQGGTLWRVNFYTKPKTPSSGEVSLKMTSSLDDENGDFNIDLANTSVPTDNLRLTVMLPGKSEYIKGTATQDGSTIEDPQTMPGAAVFRLGDLDANSKLRIRFKARLDANNSTASLPAKALLMFDTDSQKGQRTPIAQTSFKAVTSGVASTEEVKLYPHFPTFVAELQSTDVAMLEQIVKVISGKTIKRVDIVGHTDNVRIAPGSRHIFADNQALSEARAASVAEYLKQHLAMPEDGTTIRGMGKSMPVTDNSTASGRAKNRRVELYIVYEEQSGERALSVETAESDIVSLQTQGSNNADASRDEFRLAIEKEQNHFKEPVITNDWLKDHDSKLEFVWPPESYTPNIPSLQIKLKHKRGLKPKLILNGEPVNPVNFDTVKSHPTTETMISMWHGVDIRHGLNRLEAVLSNPQGEVVSRAVRELRYVVETYNVEFIEEKSRLIADGVQPPVIAIRLTDKQDRNLRPGLEGQYTVHPPYRPEETDDNVFEDMVDNVPQFTTSNNGIAYIFLEPTAQSGVVTIDIPTYDGEKTITTWLKPAPRDWILVGFAEGTVGYNKLSGNKVNLKEAGIDEHYYDDGQVRFFAKGAVKGDWLLTMAYDSDKPDLDGDSLHQAIDPDTYYPLYGDATQQGYEAASASDIYIKLEKDQAYALFGDMETGLNKTELGLYNRNLNGIKVANETDNYSVTAFAAQTKQTFAKDEIRGDGTSGRYRLSNKNIVINSDQVVIETRGRLHSESIVNLQTLTRHTDYEIDYNTGTLYFKKPIPSRDEDFNPIYIVVRYEVEGSTGENDVYGARAAVKLLDQKAEIGATYVHEEQDQTEGDLYAVDSLIELNDKVKLHIEAARTETETISGDVAGNAYIAEVDYSGDKLAAKAYYREQEDGFGLGQQNESEDGTRKYGAKASSNVTSQVSVDGEVFHEEKLATDAERNVAEVAASYQGKGYKVRTGARHVVDKLDDGTKQKSTQALAGADMDTNIKGAKLSVDFEQSLNSSNESEAYPTLLRVGGDYKVSDRVRLFANQEFTWGEENDTQATRAGMAVTPWKGGTVESSLEQNIGENGERVFGLFGLKQTWAANENWSFDASLDRSQTIKSTSGDSVNNDAAPAHGTKEDFTSVSVGATYKAETWSLTNRLETRQSDSEDKYGLTSRLIKQVNNGVAVSAKASLFINDLKGGDDTEDGSLTLGMAYRPDDSRWIILERFDFEFENAEDFTSRRLINHIHANWYMNRRVQFSLYSGVKYVYDTIGGESYDGVTDMHAAEARYNVNSRWDVGFHASWLHSWNSQTFDYAAGISVGYLVRTNTWVSLGYNFKGFEDEDFNAAQYTAQGPYMRFRMKFDQQSVQEAAEWLNE